MTTTDDDDFQADMATMRRNAAAIFTHVEGGITETQLENLTDNLDDGRP